MALPLLVVQTACNIPTELPRFDSVWEIVLLRDSISTAAILPDNVRLGDAGGFIVESFVTTSEVRLGDVCEFCTCFQGPIPALDILPYDWRLRLPARLIEAQVATGGARLVLHNSAGFDVGDDGDGNLGFLRIELVDTRTETVLQQRTIVGSFPHGDSVEVSFDLGGLTLASSLVARVSGKTPGSGCDAVNLTTENGFRADVYLEGITAPTVLAIIVDADLAIPQRQLDLPREIAERLRPGDALLSLEVTVDARLPVSTEFGLSVASDPLDLFRRGAALYTPLVIPAVPGPAPVSLKKTYLVDVAPLEGVERLFVATSNRILGSPLIRLKGGESIRYSIRLHAEIPTR